MKTYANAKVNLALQVNGLNEQGYHDLDMIMAPVSLQDVIDIQPSADGTSHVYFDGVEADFKNTLSTALEVFQKATNTHTPYSIYVEKHIPEQAGLAGGSADGAALLKALDALEHTHLDHETMMSLAVQVGADVPFCLHDAFARVQGIGEKVRPLESDWHFDLLLVKPSFGISTPACFAKWDSLEEKGVDVDLVESAIAHQNMDLLYQTMENALEKPAWMLEENLEAIKEQMMDQGLVRVMMTGSGSCLMGFSVDADVLQAAKKAMEEAGYFARVVRVGRQKSGA